MRIIKHKTVDEFGLALVKNTNEGDNPQIIDFGEHKLLTTNLHLGGGKFKHVHIFTLNGWSYSGSKRGWGKFPKKQLDIIISNGKDKLISLTDSFEDTQS